MHCPHLSLVARWVRVLDAHPLAGRSARRCPRCCCCCHCCPLLLLPLFLLWLSLRLLSCSSPSRGARVLASPRPSSASCCSSPLLPISDPPFWFLEFPCAAFHLLPSNAHPSLQLSSNLTMCCLRPLPRQQATRRLANEGSSCVRVVCVYRKEFFFAFTDGGSFGTLHIGIEHASKIVLKHF